MKTAVCTLFEGHYHLGVGALANSLFVSGFRGVLWVGFRGELPPWAAGAAKAGEGRHRLEIRDGFEIVFVQVETTLHFAYYKPDFLGRVLNEFEPDCDAAIYLDPDIIVRGPWHLLNRWPHDGVALVHDVHSLMPVRHPMRLAWREVLARHGVTADEPRDRYHNSGFVGVARTQQEFLANWRRMIEVVVAEIGPGKGFKHGPASDTFHSTDQDALNMALMIAPTPVNAAHSEAMDFSTGGYLLSHAIGSPKPWQGGFVREALRGLPPGLAIKAFMQHTESPIDLLDPSTRSKLRWSVTIGSAIGRFYGRA